LAEISAARQLWQYAVVYRQEVERLHGAEMKIFDYLVEKLRKLFMIRDLPHCQTKTTFGVLNIKLKINQTTTLHACKWKN
jgi:hypothetical protein